MEYCDQFYKQFIKMSEDDEEKNKQFKLEYKEYMYKKNYGTNFEIYIREKTYNNIKFEDVLKNNQLQKNSTVDFFCN